MYLLDEVTVPQLWLFATEALLFHFYLCYFRCVRQYVLNMRAATVSILKSVLSIGHPRP